ncbi:hypothetical protein L1049_022377 [Liquidambar formosana]|uniref:GH18 domain-containing protein n=1 Tax=Liquidambar formosana TaxID=63359 RepID=A0AAP0RCG1_LIQFO
MAPKPLPFLCFSLLLLLQLHFSAAQGVVKGGYWFPESEFPLSDIDSTLFTHLFCAFADLDTQTNQVVVSSANVASFSNFTTIVQLKNPSVITLLSIGGGNAPSSTFAAMASQSSSRATFIDSSISLARSYGFYGLDLDWEHQTMDSEMASLALLLEEWRTAIDAEATNSGLTPLILTAAFPYTPRINSVVYPSASISSSLDWVNVMAYDIFAPDPSPITRSRAALYDPNSEVSVSYGVELWIQSGVPSTQLVLGFPFYGYAWVLVNANDNGLFAPSTGPDTAVGASDGTIGYDQITAFISQNSATTVFNSTFVVDYCYAGTTWIGFDGTQTISTKVSFAKANGMLGYFAWHVGVDSNWVLSQTASQAWGA